MGKAEEDRKITFKDFSLCVIWHAKKIKNENTSGRRLGFGGAEPRRRRLLSSRRGRILHRWLQLLQMHEQRSGLYRNVLCRRLQEGLLDGSLQPMRLSQWTSCLYSDGLLYDVGFLNKAMKIILRRLKWK